VIARQLLAAGLLAAPLDAQDTTSAPISDNSFLIEEAYNQESGVVQHISSFIRPNGSGAWAYSFTQEWPFRGSTHQVSYTIPVLSQSGSGTGLGDIALNYRYQLVARDDAGVHVAPRLSLLVPTGNEGRGRGSGGLGLQTNLPLSVRPRPWLALHANAGLTWTPDARNAARETASTLSGNLGASAIWLFRPDLNFMLELLWLTTEDVTGPDQQQRENALFLNPGVRWAFNFASGLQIVPGVAYTVGLDDGAGPDALFLYLSFEHPFRH
jgi:Putative MetA-pathway of phenol degradation